MLSTLFIALAALALPPPGPAPFDLRLPARGATRADIERAWPQCARNGEQAKTGTRCTVYSVRVDAKGVDSSWGWCLDGAGCVPRWTYHFDREGLLAGVTLRVETVDADEAAFEAQSEVAKRMRRELAERFGDPAIDVGHRRTYRDLVRLKGRATLELQSAVWMSPEQRIALDHRAINGHHPVVETVLVFTRR